MAVPMYEVSSDMKVSELWLRELVDPPITTAELAKQLTMAGLEVDSIYPVAGDFTKVITARVVQTQPHPKADKLSLCQVAAANGEVFSIVCGAANVRAGLVVALAIPGAQLPNDIVIKESTIRGELSQGMLCSTAELGITEHAEGILELPLDTPIGVDLRKYLSLHDTVLDISTTPNRADCLSIVGVAREVAALNRLSLPDSVVDKVNATIDDKYAVNIDVLESCPHYCGRLVRGINVDATTPLWMQERLRRVGVSLVHPVVDIMNYVMFEYGQPLHAFDAVTIKDCMITVRYSSPSETLQLLDGKVVELDAQTLVIADAHAPIALAGIIGGLPSAVAAHTTDFWIESAFFTPHSISGVARKYGLCTDASQRFERGVDPTLQQQALERACTLMHTIVGGNFGPIISVYKPEYLQLRRLVNFNPAKVLQLTGVEVAVDEMLDILHALGMTVDNTKLSWVIEVPSFRFDILEDVDIVEEIIRLYGYDRIIAAPLLSATRAGMMSANEQLLTYAGQWFSVRGYHETINYSFVDRELQTAIYIDMPALSLQNPIATELADMRIGLWPGLIASMLYNQNRQQLVLKLFESGIVFDMSTGTLQERACIAGLWTGVQGELNWGEEKRAIDFFDMKGDLQAFFAAMHIADVHFRVGQHGALHPQKTAEIFIGDRSAGWLGALHPRLLDMLSIDGEEVFVFELSLDALQHIVQVQYQQLSKYPQIRRDLSFVVDEMVSVAQLEEVIYCIVPHDWLKGLYVFDVYVGESITAGKKSIAIALILQDDKRTLVDTEINAVIDSIISGLSDKFAIVLRA